MILKLIVYLLAGMGAGIGTGLAGLSAATVISPMLITFLHFDPYQAVGIALASDVLASAVSAYTYKKHGNLDVRHGVIMLFSVLAFTLVGSYIASLLPGTTMGNFSVFMTLLLGIKFIIRPVMTEKSALENKSERTKIIQSLLCGAVIGFICGFIGAGGGMMMPPTSSLTAPCQIWVRFSSASCSLFWVPESQLCLPTRRRPKP